MKDALFDPTAAMVAERGTLIVIWKGEPKSAALSLAAKQMLLLHRTYPREVFMLNVITEATGMPDAATRQTLQGLFEQMRGKLAAAAIALEHRGVLQNLSRAVISSLVTVTRQPFPLKVFGSRAAATQWLGAHDGAPSANRLSLRLGELAAAAALEQPP